MSTFEIFIQYKNKVILRLRSDNCHLGFNLNNIFINLKPLLNISQAAEFGNMDTILQYWMVLRKFIWRPSVTNNGTLLLLHKELSCVTRKWVLWYICPAKAQVSLCISHNLNVALPCTVWLLKQHSSCCNSLCWHKDWLVSLQDFEDPFS